MQLIKIGWQEIWLLFYHQNPMIRDSASGINFNRNFPIEILAGVVNF